MKKQMPRARFCWECGKQLRSFKIHVEVVVDGHPRILHKACAKKLEREKEGAEK